MTDRDRDKQRRGAGGVSTYRLQLTISRLLWPYARCCCLGWPTRWSVTAVARDVYDERWTGHRPRILVNIIWHVQTGLATAQVAAADVREHRLGAGDGTRITVVIVIVVLLLSGKHDRLSSVLRILLLLLLLGTTTPPAIQSPIVLVLRLPIGALLVLLLLVVAFSVGRSFVAVFSFFLFSGVQGGRKLVSFTIIDLRQV